MQGAFDRMVAGTTILAITLAIAILGYMALGWTPLEAIYMVIITIFGVGYGEVKPLETPMEELPIPGDSLMIGRTIRELEVRAKGAFIVIGLRRLTDPTLIQPTQSLMLDRGDTVVILGRKTEIPKFASHNVLQPLTITNL
ncbi:MAG: TrkA C-terminal domain-containing protein [Spirulinaceae cyanobacterium]